MDLWADRQHCHRRNQVRKTSLTSARQRRIVFEVTRHIVGWFARVSAGVNTGSNACEAVSSCEVCPRVFVLGVECEVVCEELSVVGR